MGPNNYRMVNGAWVYQTGQEKAQVECLKLKQPFWVPCLLGRRVSSHSSHKLPHNLKKTGNASVEQTRLSESHIPETSELERTLEIIESEMQSSKGPQKSSLPISYF